MRMIVSSRSYFKPQEFENPIWEEVISYSLEDANVRNI